MPSIIRIPTGLVFSLDFARNSKDATWRANGSLVATKGTAMTVDGGKATSIDDSDSWLTYPMGDGTVAPGEKGCVLIDCDMKAQAVASDAVFAFRPSVAAANNSLDLYRHGSGVMRCDIYDNAGNNLFSTDRSVGTGARGRATMAVAWDGFGGSGACTVYNSEDGAGLVSSNSTDKTRDESDTDGDIRLCAYSWGGHNFLGNIYRVAIFNVTNPCGQDLTANGWDAATIWASIFPQGGGGAGLSS